MSFIRLFGADEKEQIRGVVTLVIVAYLAVVVFLLIIDPAFGQRSTHKSLNLEVVSVLVSLITLCLGYLAGDRGKSKEKD